MEEREFVGENNALNKNEFNPTVESEENKIDIQNEDVKLYCTETNSFFSKSTLKEKRKESSVKKMNLMRHFSSFIALCAMATIIQTSFPIPIFSQIFGRTTTVNNPAYSFSTISSTCKSVSYSITIDEVDDFDKTEYCIMLVKEGNDTDEYVASIPVALKRSHKVIVSSNNVSGSFDKFISQEGINRLKNGEDYVVVLLRDEKIVKKESVKTKSYITKLTFDGINDSLPVGSEGYYTHTYTEGGIDYRFLNVDVYIDESFDNFHSLYIELTNVTNEPYTKDATTMNESGVNGQMSFGPRFLKDSPQQRLKFKIYCYPKFLKDLDYTETMTPDGVVTYYLIYSHPDVIIF